MGRNMWKRWLTFTLCIAVLAASPGIAAAENLPSGLADSELASAMDAYVDEHSSTTAALSVAIVRGQQVLFERAYGYADIAEGRAADEDTVYEWGSVTKLLVWVSVMQLVEQGKLDLEADIRVYLPEGFLSKLRYDTPPTMLNLMHHNAGWEDVMIELFVEPASVTASLEKTLRGSEPNQIYEPNTMCAYSNWGVALAGFIVERVSGQFFDEYVQQNIFAPLGMRHTALSPKLEDSDWVRKNRLLTQGYAGLEPIKNLYAIPLYPAGMATGTLHDFLLFLKALLPEVGAPSPLFNNPQTLADMLTPSLFYGDGSARNSHGFWMLDFGVTAIGHGGNTAAFSSYLMIHPESKTGMVVMTNQANESVFNTGLPILVFGKFEPALTDKPLPDARDLHGLYISSRATLNGCSKISSLMSMIPILGGEEDTLEISLMGLSMVFEQAVPDLFVSAEDADLAVIESVRVERAVDGGVRLTMPYFEFIRMSTVTGIGWVATLALLMLALGYCIVVLVYEGIRRLILRLQHRKSEASVLRKYHLFLCVLALVEGANIAWMAANLMTFASKAMIGINIGLFWLCAAGAVTYLAILALKMNKAGYRRKEKTLYLTTGIVALVMLLNIIIWQLYRF